MNCLKKVFVVIMCVFLLDCTALASSSAFVEIETITSDNVMSETEEMTREEKLALAKDKLKNQGFTEEDIEWYFSEEDLLFISEANIQEGETTYYAVSEASGTAVPITQGQAIRMVESVLPLANPGISSGGVLKTTITPSVSGDVCYVLGQFEWLLQQSPVDRFTDVFGITVSSNMIYYKDGSRRYLANKTVYNGTNATSSTPAGTTYLYSGNHATAIKFNMFDDVLTDDYNYTVYSKHRGAVATYFTMTDNVGSAATHYWHATGIITPSISVGSEIGVGLSYQAASVYMDNNAVTNITK